MASAGAREQEGKMGRRQSTVKGGSEQLRLVYATAWQTTHWWMRGIGIGYMGEEGLSNDDRGGRG